MNNNSRDAELTLPSLGKINAYFWTLFLVFRIGYT